MTTPTPGSPDQQNVISELDLMAGNLESLTEVIASGRERRAIEHHGEPVQRSLLVQALRAESEGFARDILASEWLSNHIRAARETERERLAQLGGRYYDVVDREIAKSIREDQAYVAAHDDVVRTEVVAEWAAAVERIVREPFDTLDIETPSDCGGEYVLEQVEVVAVDDLRGLLTDDHSAALDGVKAQAARDAGEHIAHEIEMKRVHTHPERESACDDGCGWLDYAADIARSAFGDEAPAGDGVNRD